MCIRDRIKTGVFNDLNGDGCSDVDETITYTFTVTNQVNVSLANIVVTDPLLEAPNPVVAIVFVGGDTDGDTELDPTETWEYTADYAVTQDDINAGEVENQATVEGTAPNGDVATDLSDPISITEDNPTITELCQDAIDEDSIAIIKTGVFNDLNGDGCSDVDETITYTFTVTNQTSLTLSNIVVTDPLLEAPNPVVAIAFVSGDENDNGELDPTETWVYTADYAVTQDDINAGEVENQATVEGTAPNGDVATDLSDPVSITENTPTITDVCQDPIVDNESIAIIKTGVFNDLNGDGCSDAGETITYTFTVTNQVNISLANIVVTDPLLEAPNPVVAITFVSGDDNSNGELDPTETWEYTCLLYTSPSPRDRTRSRMPSSA